MRLKGKEGGEKERIGRRRLEGKVNEGKGGVLGFFFFIAEVVRTSMSLSTFPFRGAEEGCGVVPTHAGYVAPDRGDGGRAE